ncbi:hypothetical protein SLA2020_435340 [Shorea laevis]
MLGLGDVQLASFWVVGNASGGSIIVYGKVAAGGVGGGVRASFKVSLLKFWEMTRIDGFARFRAVVGVGGRR